MQMVTTIDVDIAKSVFQVHGTDAAGQVVSIASECGLAHMTAGSARSRGLISSCSPPLT